MDARVTSDIEAGEEAPADELLLWILVWSELAAFGILLVAFLVTGVLQAEAFAAGRNELNPLLAGINTLVLLTSGWQAALAARKSALPGERRRALVMAALLGFVFVAIKLTEYSGELASGDIARFGAFFELYFLITGFHLLHVAFGGLILLLVAWRPTPGNVTLITTLWHVIDLIWIVMFPIIYLV
ncbi:nitric oxide reductase NorE protein [Sinorhizobium terangae]|uniref:Cytochrome c oxidase subunit 3 family protein n=1 Tax=Sinorhizobium terangae TaxID=110322 RepID=A0A6N7LDY3_SINTE|nr:cytochrome c oxidase subunit 3 [Sinorhizobium terangae]MBB4186461.1 nitric oxide reductase NorE protein [Sinorhizobium terangae]MQX16063.1 cytochrome c oxidase subunit 3 family protein [Sinorhizobium terangae]